jgi:AcrR family transcriptional regulator
LRNPRKAAGKPGRPTAAEIERRKQRALEVAADLFVRQGFAATSFVEIAAEAGVASGTLYHHFGDKEQMFRRVILAVDDTRPARPTLEPGDTLHAALLKVGRYVRETTLRSRGVSLMRLLILESGRVPELSSDLANDSYDEFEAIVARCFAKLEEAGLLPAGGDHRRSAELFIDLVLGSLPLRAYANWHAKSPTEQDLDDRVALFIRGRYPDLPVTPTA